MPSSPFPPRPAPPSRQDDPGGSRTYSRASSNTPVRMYSPQNQPPRTPKSILRPTPPSHIPPPQHDPTMNPQILRPQPPPNPRSITPSPYHHLHTSSSPELRPRVDNAWVPRARPSPQQHSPDPSLSGGASAPTHTLSYIDPRPRPTQADAAKRRSAFAVRVASHIVPGFRGRSASDARAVHTPPPDLEPDRLARACGQSPPFGSYHDDQTRHGIPIDTPSSRHKDPGTARSVDAPPAPPKIRVEHMYRRLDALARRAGGRVMDYISFGDLVAIHKRDNQLREQLRRRRSERLLEKVPNFHAIGAPLEDVFLYASAPIIIGDYQHHLPIVVVACVEELTKTGIYQSGLFRALPSRDRHLQLIDLFDKSSDYGAHFNMRGQAMPDICALLSTFISSIPSPLLDPQVYAALWQWSVKPSVKRQDARRDEQEEEEEDRRARGEPPQAAAWMSHTDLYLDDGDATLESDQISTAQILLRFLPSTNLSLLMYLCAFFTQLPLCPENGLQLEDVARIFGHRLLGGSVKVTSQRMMMWLLTRWQRISEMLFAETCGMTPPPLSPPHLEESTSLGEVNGLRIDKRKGKRQSTSDDVMRQAPSSSSSYTSLSTELPEDRRESLRKSSDGEEEEFSEGSRRRKKRELELQEPHAHAPTIHRSSTRKETRHGHGHRRRGSGSRRHHLEKTTTPAPPDPFALAFAKAQHDLANAPLLATPSSSPVAEGGDVDWGNSKAFTQSQSQSRADTAQQYPYRETPIRIAGFDAKDEEDENENASERRNGVDIVRMDTRGVDVLLQESGVTADATRALADRVEALERALKVQNAHDGGEGQKLQCSTIPQHHGADKGEGLGVEDQGGKREGDRGVEDGLRLQLRLVEAERDQAQRIVRDMRAYLLEGVALQRSDRCPASD